MLQRSTLYGGVVLLLLLIGLSCQTQPTSEKKENKTDSSEVPLFDKPFSEYSKYLTGTVLSLKGHFRGAELGMTKEEIKGIEKAQFEELILDTLDNESMRFSTDFDLNSNADFEYLFGKSNSLDKIIASIYFDDILIRDSVYNEFINFYTSEWGQAQTITPSFLNWQPSDLHSLEIQTEGGNLQPTIVIAITRP